MEIQTVQTENHTNKIKLFSGPGTRQWPRFNIEDVPSIRGIRSNAGSRIKISNISRGGALLQTWRQQVPGTRIGLKVETAGKIIPLSGVVLRSSVFTQNEIFQYQVAVAFNRPLPIPDIPAIEDSETVQVGTDSPNMSDSIPRMDNGSSSQYASGENLSMIDTLLSIRFANDPEEEPDEMSKLNQW